jgi:hypothetical protein
LRLELETRARPARPVHSIGPEPLRGLARRPFTGDGGQDGYADDIAHLEALVGLASARANAAVIGHGDDLPELAAEHRSRFAASPGLTLASLARTHDLSALAIDVLGIQRSRDSSPRGRRLVSDSSAKSLYRRPASCRPQSMRRSS